MKLTDLYSKEDIIIVNGVKDFKTLIEKIFPDGIKGKGIKFEKEYISENICERESSFPTIINERVSIPHLRLDGIEAPIIKIAIVKKGVRSCIKTDVKFKLFFIFITPKEQPETHLQILAKLMGIIKNNEIIDKIINSGDSAKLYGLMKSEEETGKVGYVNIDKKSIFFELQTSEAGLSSAEAEKRLKNSGLNELKKAKGTPTIIKLLKNFISLFAVLLWIGGAMCFIPGVDMPQLGYAIFAVIIINGLFSFAQEYKAEKAMEALKKLLPHETTVLRDGIKTKIISTKIVYGDVIYIEEGDLIPADARLIQADELRVNNSSLTGESRPSYKMAEPIEDKSSLLWTEISNMIFAGTSVSAGSGIGVVVGTGMNTEIGRIAGISQSVKKELTPLQLEMKRVVNTISVISVGLGILFFFLGRYLGGLSYISAFVFTIGITVANIPEGLLPTISLSLAMSVQRMAKKNIFVKHLASVETLGSTSVICTDKTGTLTTNQISVCQVYIDENIYTVEGSSYEPKGDIFDNNGKKINLKEFTDNTSWPMFFKAIVLCNNAKLTQNKSQNNEWDIVGDPTEGALLVLAGKAGADNEAITGAYKRIGHIPFESVRKRMTTVNEAGGYSYIFTKGAPLEVLSKCQWILLNGKKTELSDKLRKKISAQNDKFASEGLRVLAAAYREEEAGNKGNYTKENTEQNLIFIGLTAMIDPPRPEVFDAIKKCKEAGIRIIMITGDYGLTARAIANKIGIADNMENVMIISGSELENIKGEELKKILAEKRPVIFARMEPVQKMTVVSVLKEMGEIVAVTGDGVNDAIALRKADIGIAMGTKANDVAKESASMIVIDGNFASIVYAVEEGRAVYANIKRFVTYIFTSNVPELVPFILFVMLKIPLPLTVMQILAIDLGTDLVPALALGVEAPEPGIMQKPPRPKSERLINLNLFARAYIFLGLIEASLCMAAYYFVYFTHGWQPGMVMDSSGDIYKMATTMSLAGIVAVQIGNIFCCRTHRASVFKVGLFSNKMVMIGIATEIALIFIFVYTPVFQNIFGLTPLGIKEWAFLALFGPIILIMEELRKYAIRKIEKRVKYDKKAIS